jgi:hypothetical protein
MVALGAILAVASTAAAADGVRSPFGPDPCIRPAAAFTAPAGWPAWESPDIGVDETGVWANVTNCGTDPASNFRVRFFAGPPVTSWFDASVPVGDVEDMGTLAPGGSRSYHIDWTPADLALGMFPPEFGSWDLRVISLYAVVEPRVAGSGSDRDPFNNSASRSVAFFRLSDGVLEVIDAGSKDDDRHDAQIFVRNPTDLEALVSLQWSTLDPDVSVALTGMDAQGAAVLKAHETREVRVRLVAGPAAPLWQGKAVSADLSARLDGKLVGGVTLRALPAFTP